MSPQGSGASRIQGTSGQRRSSSAKRVSCSTVSGTWRQRPSTDETCRWRRRPANASSSRSPVSIVASIESTWATSRQNPASGRIAKYGASSALVLENMDARKTTGRTVAELAPFFAVLPEAGFCLDVAHVLSIDATLETGERLLDAFAGRLRHLHVSSVDGRCRHVPLTVEHETRFAELLRRCPDVPWILEAPLP